MIKNMEDKKIVTIDLGSDKLAVCVASVNENHKLTVLYCREFRSDGIKHSRVSNPMNLSAQLKETLKTVEEDMNIKIDEVMVNVQRYGIREVDCNIKATTSNGVNITVQDIDFLCDLAEKGREGLESDEEVVACIPQCYDADNGEINVSPEEIVGMCSANITGKYKIYALKKAWHNVIDNAFAGTGVITVHKVFVPEYTGTSVLSENEIQGGVALIDLGAGATSVSIFQGGRLRHYGAIPFGGVNITYDIANICNIDVKLAENIKKAFGGCIPSRLGTLGEKKIRITDNVDKSHKELSVKYLSEIISARQKEIIDAILYEIQASGYADKLRNGVVLTGGGASMMNICQYFKDISGYQAKLCVINQERIASEDMEFYNQGAAMSAGLLRKYSLMETVGCRSLEQPQEEDPLLKEDLEKPEEKPSEEHKSLFGGLLRSWGESPKASKAKTPKPAKQPKAEKAAKQENNEPTLGFWGEDEQI